MTVAKEVVQFLMGIFGDRQAAQGFLDDPEGVLEKHGLAGVSSADVDAAMPVVLDYAPLSVTASAADRDFNPGVGTGHAGGGWSSLPAGGGHDDHGQAVEQLTHVVANYSYSSTPDDRGALPDQSPALNIWADGDVEQWFDNDSVPEFGDPAISAGTGMGFADIRIDGFFDLDADRDTATVSAGQAAHPATFTGEPLSEEHQPYVDIDVDAEAAATDAGLEFSEDGAATIDIDNDIDNAGAGEAADSMDFGA
ncbi:IniB N-terminal domain-containing protein [Pseudarthrobacter quantipunctorum]|uniref:IniB N-terminal domain-containing protein n=1 Tax=Pseudarthrobacter quantipunctorum TaxID=3128980 RepID=A0ABZ2R5W1_9MICC